MLAQYQNEVLKVQGKADEGSVKANLRALTFSDRKILGLNDGTIFPKSHFGKPVPVMAMSNAALERTPLSGAIKCVYDNIPIL